MKRLTSFILTLLLTLELFTFTVRAAEPEISAPSAILIEVSTGGTIYEKNPDESLHPASITKIMTLLLIFEAIENGKTTLNDTVTVSEHAASMGGSQVFLEAGETQTVNTMIKCISIASANDACVAMAEHIAGSEEAFVEKMNERAKELGMNNTTFRNSCGLDEDGHMTTARDVSIMSRELITKHPQIHNYSTIWMDTITHLTRRGSKEFTLANTNKLIKQYEWATGLKTGSTSLAKFCLSASAKRNNIELISVVMASPDGKTRIRDSINLLNYGYANCSLYKSPAEGSYCAPVKNGVKDDVECYPKTDFTYMFLKAYDAQKISSKTEYNSELKAPIEKDAVIGQIIYYYDSREIGSVDLLAKEAVQKSDFSHHLKILFHNLI